MKLRGLRGRTFVAVTIVSIVALGVAGVLTQFSLRAQLMGAISRTLVAEARLSASLLVERLGAAPTADLDAEADRIGALTAARVTLIAPDGRVVGDSTDEPEAVRRYDNHGSRPEVIDARRAGFGVARRHSDTLGTDLLYAAVTVRDARVAVVRLALPLTDVDQQVAAVRRGMLFALVVALTCAVGLAWVSSMLLSRRVQAIAAVATRYAAGDFSQPLEEHGTDELGTVARALDRSAHELGRRVTELAQDRAQKEAILAGMLEGVLVLNAQGRVTLVNNAAKRLLHTDDLAPGQHHVEILRHPDVGAMLARALAGSSPDGLEFSPPHDPNRTVMARAAPVATAGTRGAVLVLHDISDLRHADRMRRDFVANVSHELRTPLTAIRGYVEALLDEEPPNQTETRGFLEIIDRQATRMERLVRDLLRLARLEAGQEPIERESCSVASVFAGVTTELASAIDDRPQQVVTRIDAAATTVESDPAKLHDAIRNLVENAIVYSPPHTTIELASQRDGNAIVLSVSDEGPGIPDADLVRVFERFYRVDKARSRESGGTGLGLSIVKHLVTLLGGEVKATNRVGGGAVFTVRLPAA